MAVIDGFTNEVINTISMPNLPPYPGSNGRNSHANAIVYNPFNNLIYVSHWNTEYVTAMDETNTIVKKIKVGYNPITMGMHPNNHNLYVSNQPHQPSHGPNTVSVIRTEKEPAPILPAVCPEENVKHWDKIVFKITSSALANKANVSANKEFDIKVPDNPLEVADLKQKVLDFLRMPNENSSSVKIIDVDYAITCAEQTTK